MENYILLRDTEEKINALLESRPLTEKINPIVNLVQTSNYYYIYIFLNGLIKKHISFRYVNNFLILNLSLVCTYNNKISEYKRTLYVKNLDIKNIQNTINSNMLKYKIPIT
jgi:cell division FtsZ-interacting protein ZapD